MKVTGYPRYDSYKDSGIDWIGEVPKHWELKPLKHGSRIVLGKMLCTTHKGGYFKKPYLKSKNIQWLSVNISDVDEMWFSRQELTQYRLRAGDLILSEGGEVGKTCIWNNELDECYIQNSAHKVTMLPDNSPEYFLYQMYSAGANGWFDANVNRVSIGHLTHEKLSNIAFLFPPLPEQRAIATFLDAKCAKIDQAIHIHETQITLLRERRQILIQQAVTRGLNPTAPMKDSGIEWIGEIPAHWEVIAIKHLVETPITDGPHETPTFFDEGVPFVSAEAVSSGWVDFTKIRGFISHVDHIRYSQKYCPRRGDIFMIKSGATTGVTAIVETDKEFNIWSPLAVIRCGKIAYPYFLLNFMRSSSFQKYVALSWSYGTQQNIGMGVLGNSPVVLPPLTEQRAIVEYLAHVNAKIDRAITLKQSQITALKEYKTVLIDSAVTGKIRLPPVS